MITKEEIQKELALRELSRRSLKYYVPYVDPFYWTKKWYLMKPFHEVICDKIQQLYKWTLMKDWAVCRRLMISVPPQHGKSTISSQRFPLWAYNDNPTLSTVLASYSGELSKSHLSKMRQIIDWDRANKIWKINLIKDTSTSFETKEGGEFTAVWVWGSLTGKPVDIGIIDDVHKDRAEYESDTIRNSVWDWYTSVFLSRLHNDSIQLLVMTRWWEDDLFGRILEKEWHLWEVLNIPAVTDYSKQEVIFPERFTYDLLMEKRNMNERDFQSLYMWDPINEWWGSFKKEYFMEYDIAPSELTVYTFLDPAISQKQEADYTAIITIGIDKNNRIYILDIFHEKVEPSDTINALFQIVQQYKPQRVWVEVVAFQKMLALEIRKQMNIRNIFFNLDEINPMGEKNARIKTILEPRYSNANVLHPKYNKNIKDFELELLKFPNGKHDDMIDALSWAVRMAEVDSIWNDYVVTHNYSSLF